MALHEEGGKPPLRRSPYDPRMAGEQDAEFTLAPDELAERLERGTAQVIDLSAGDEPVEGSIAGARRMSLRELAAEAITLAPDRVVVFCGADAPDAARVLRASGYTAYALAGGPSDWRAAGLPLSSP